MDKNRQHTDNSAVKNYRSAPKSLLKVLALAAFMGLFFIYFIRNKDDFETITTIHPLVLGGVFVLQIAIILTNAWMLSILCSAYGKYLNKTESFAVTVKSSIINFFGFFQGGAGYKAIYLKKNYSLSWSAFLSLYIANYLVVFAVSSLVAMAALVLQWISGFYINPLVFITFLVIALGTVSLMIFGYRKDLPEPYKVFRLVNRGLASWRFIVTNKSAVRQLFLLALLQSFLLSLTFYLELLAIGTAPLFAGVMIYAGLANISLLFAITPAAIGFRESVLVLAQNSLGVNTSDILVSSIIDRAVYFIVLAFGFLFVHKGLIRFFQRKKHKYLA